MLIHNKFEIAQYIFDHSEVNVSAKTPKPNSIV